LEDAHAAVKAGADALGFVFYKKSPRYIAPQAARDIIRKLPAKVRKIGVFVNAAEKYIRRVSRLCGLDMLQFHGSESAQFCRRFKGYRIIKAYRIKSGIDLKGVLQYKPYAYLFDTFCPEKLGGTGKKFNWKLLQGIDVKQPVFLSGGLNARNVKKAIALVRPAWVDVSTSVESRPGKKDRRKLRAFIKAAKG
jgi:phosphoribosylanthranilate isomerase